MGKFTYLVIHCADTPKEMEVTKEMLQEWHMGPCDQPDGSVRYREKTYPSRDDLPEEYLNGKCIRELKGNGWARLGYSNLIHRDGQNEIITPYNYDDIITDDEMTWGATGVNAVSRHICLVGGKLKPFIIPPLEFLSLFTREQWLSLRDEVQKTIAYLPNILVGGHYHFNKKNCPNFDVHKFMLGIDRPGNSYETKKQYL
jgi:N-acetylmuramoyl-L-alanine amidase